MQVNVYNKESTEFLIISEFIKITYNSSDSNEIGSLKIQIFCLFGARNSLKFKQL